MVRGQRQRNSRSCGSLNAGCSGRSAKPRPTMPADRCACAAAASSATQSTESSSVLPSAASTPPGRSTRAISPSARSGSNRTDGSGATRRLPQTTRLPTVTTNSFDRRLSVQVSRMACGRKSVTSTSDRTPRKPWVVNRYRNLIVGDAARRTARTRTDAFDRGVAAFEPIDVETPIRQSMYGSASLEARTDSHGMAQPTRTLCHRGA
jgi:hypothetical protein